MFSRPKGSQTVLCLLTALSFLFTPKTISKFLLFILFWLVGSSSAKAGINVWTSIGLQGESINTLAIDPQTPTTLYAGANGGGVFKSTDRGSSWSAINRGITYTGINALAIDPQAPTTLYAASEYGGVYKSIDGGQVWVSVNNGIALPFALAINPQTPTTLYAGSLSDPFYVEPNGVFKSTDSGETWSNVGLDDIRALIIDPQSPSTLYAGRAYVHDVSTYGGIYKTTDGGATWEALKIDLTYTRSDGVINTYLVGSLAINPKAPTTIYAATGGGVFKSSDGGESWSKITELGDSALAIDPQMPAVLYAGTGNSGVFKSTDGGESWSAFNTGLTNLDVNALAIDPQNPRILYAGTTTGIYSIYQNSSPSANAVSPMNSTTPVNTAQTLTTVYSDPEGWQDIAAASLYFSGNGGVHNEWLHFFVAPSLFTMMGSNDSCSPGQAKTISSGYLTLDCGASSISGSGNTLTIIYHLTPQPSSSGLQYNIFSTASDQGGGAAAAIFAGRWNIQ
jgi:photosystem II stability/assembly factor-like uncharacterized protein